jgi:hypothetical protein
LLVHPVFESLSPVDENHGNLVVVETAHLGVRIDVDLTPVKTAALVQLHQAFFDNLAEMTSLAGINNDLAYGRHAGQSSSIVAFFQRPLGEESKISQCEKCAK